MYWYWNRTKWSIRSTYSVNKIKAIFLSLYHYNLIFIQFSTRLYNRWNSRNFNIEYKYWTYDISNYCENSTACFSNMLSNYTASCMGIKSILVMYMCDCSYSFIYLNYCCLWSSKIIQWCNKKNFLLWKFLFSFFSIWQEQNYGIVCQ